MPETVGRGCPPERARDGEVRLVFLGDSGYGSGVSEWGTHGQEAVAARINHLALAPDLVFFLGDNIYWLGNAELYKSRFDDIYDPLIRECRAHVALGNHDVKGCRAVEEYEQWESCFQELRTAMVADLKARHLRQGMSEEEATERAETEAKADMAGALQAEALAVEQGQLPARRRVRVRGPGRRCLPRRGRARPRAVRLRFGGEGRSAEERRASATTRSSIRCPAPRAAALRTSPADPEERPLVDVIVLDTNTLHVEGSVLGKSDKPREDRLQMLWLRSAMAQWLPAPEDDRRIWKILAMHHPPQSPRGCACLFFGKCLGGHGDQVSLDRQLKHALEGLAATGPRDGSAQPLYARSHPLDEEGRPQQDGRGGVRYFVAGGGGAPLYGIKDADARWARTGSIYHFVYMRLTSTSAFFWTIDENGRTHDSGCFEKGSNVDLPLSPDFRYDDALPPRCATDGSQPAVSPRTTPETPSPAPPGQAAGAPDR